VSAGPQAGRTVVGAVFDAAGRPALFLKPPSALAGDGADISAPSGLVVEVVPCLAVSMGGSVRAAADITLPELLPTLYRPPVRAKGRDGFLPVGGGGASRQDLGSPVRWVVAIGGAVVAGGDTGRVLEYHRRIVEEASSFMTLEDDDLVLVALGPGIPVERSRPVRVGVDGIGGVTFTGS